MGHNNDRRNSPTPCENMSLSSINENKDSRRKCLDEFGIKCMYFQWLKKILEEN